MEATEVSVALSQLYNPLSSPRMRRRADSLLQRFQRTPEAAQSALRVLQAPIVDCNCAQVKAERAFAASTIYFTVASYVRTYKLENPAAWTDVEREQHAALSRDFEAVCQEVWNVLTGPNGTHEEFSVQTQLALTIAVILLRFHEQHDSANATIVSAVEWLVTNQQVPAAHDDVTASLTNFAILLTLKVIPEEVENKRVKFSKTKRAQCEALVRQSAPIVVTDVLPKLALAIDADAKLARLRSLLLKCFASWVEFGGVAPHAIVASGLLDRAFRETTAPLVSNTALLCIREVVRACTSETCIPLMELVMQHFVMLGSHLSEQLAAMKAAAATGVVCTTSPSPSPSSSSSSSQQQLDALTSCLQGCAVAIAECGQAFIMYFVDYTLDLEPGSLVYAFLDTVLAFTAMDDLAISNETMAFWIDFRLYISGKHEQRMAAFETFVARLLRLLVERTEYPESYERFASAARECFVSYRNDVRAVFRSLATVTQASEDAFVVDAIHVVLHQYELLDAGDASRTWWKRTEVYVHALSAVSKSIREDDLSLVPQLFARLARAVPCHPALARTVTIFLGVMGHWFARNPQYLGDFAFAILSQSFEQRDHQPSSPFSMQLDSEDHIGAVALKKLTQRCGHAFVNARWLDAMLQLYRSSRATFTATAGQTQTALTGNSVALVVESIGHVVATLSYADALPVVNELGAILFADVATQFPVLSDVDDACSALLCEGLEHLYVLATTIPSQLHQSVPHPVLCLLQTHWSVVEAVLQTFGTNEDVMDKLCALLVALFTSLRTQALELASAVMPLVLEQFRRSLDGSFLAVIKSVVACAGDDAESTASLTRVVVMVSNCALAHIAAATSVDDCAALVVALLDLARSCGALRPQILVKSNELESLLALVLHALRSQHPDVGNAALDFLADVGAWYGEVLRLPPHLLRTGALDGPVALHELIRSLFFDKDVQYHVLVALFNAAAGTLPPSLLERVAEVVRSCWSCFGRQRSEELIARLLADDAFVGSHVALRARTEFAGTIAKPECIDNARKFKRVLAAFCDHFRKTVVAASAVPSAASSVASVVAQRGGLSVTS